MIRCATCSACEPHTSKDPATGKLYTGATCHAGPPVLVPREGGLSFAFPLVTPTAMWCRQWEPRAGFNEKGERTDQLTTDKPKLVLEN